MTTLVINSDAADGGIESSHPSTYATARSGNSLNAYTTQDFFFVGQVLSGSYYCETAYVGFDSSPLGASANISAAPLTTTLKFDPGQTTAWTAQAYDYDWGTTLTTADYLPGATAAGLTLRAHKIYSAFAVDTPVDWVDDAMVAAVNKTGFTRLALVSDRFVAGNAPTGTEFFYFYSADATGTSFDPKLTVTYTLGTPRSFGIVI